jgi:hypothetical protein
VNMGHGLAEDVRSNTKEATLYTVFAIVFHERDSLTIYPQDYRDAVRHGRRVLASQMHVMRILARRTVNTVRYFDSRHGYKFYIESPLT